MEGTTVRSQPPKAMIHQRILDAASSRPDASIEGIADDVSGASGELVERVLDRYGDPAESEPSKMPEQEGGPVEPTDTEPADDDIPSSVEPPEPQSLSEKVRRTLREVYETPDATQQDIAQRLGVTGATISKRLTNVEGFDWSDREAFVDNLFGPRLLANGSGRSLNDLPELEGRVTELEQSMADKPPNELLSSQPELAHKVIRVCMDSEDFNEEEELELIRAIIG